MIRTSRFVLGTATATLLLLGAMGADQKTQTIKARGLSFQAPADWKASEPQSKMRAAELKAGPVEGDKEPAELVVFVFPGAAGTVQANIDRWQSQFEDENGQPPKVTSEKRKGKNVAATFVEIAGRYVAPIRPGSPEKFNKPGFRLLGAIVETPEASYFLKMVGPDKTMKANKQAFDDLIKSLAVEQ
jgi:hypothetical protein